MDLRRAVEEDIPAMHRLRVAVRENALSSPDRIGHGDYLTAMADGQGWVATLDSAVVGFAFASAAGNVWALFVDPAHEGRGVGSALHETLVDWLVQNASRPFWLTTATGTRAERFYRGRGWRDCGIVASGERRFEWQAEGGDSRGKPSSDVSSSLMP